MPISPLWLREGLLERNTLRMNESTAHPLPDFRRRNSPFWVRQALPFADQDSLVRRIACTGRLLFSRTSSVTSFASQFKVRDRIVEPSHRAEWITVPVLLSGSP